MTDKRDLRERSVSGDFEDSDLELDEGSNPPGKPGRKKNPNSQAARRDQNRIAQREFRLRKQQRIRDLEARVEILSGGKDEALGHMKEILKDLMQENQTLRNLLRSLSSFIGDGAGGLLPKLGWDMSDFNNFINRSETDTAWEGYQRRKKAQTAQPTASTSQGLKRPTEDDSNGPRQKKSRGNEQDGDGERGSNGYPLLVPMNPPGIGNNMFPPSARSPQDSALFSDLMRGPGGSPMFMQPSPSASSSQYGGTPSANPNNFRPATYMPTLGMNIEPTLAPLPFASGSSSGPNIPQGVQPANHQSHSPQDDLEGDDDPGKTEAYKLVHYHLDNYKRNAAYCLPASLRPTLVQRTVPHESVIDRILHPELRDRMILLRGRFDLVDCLHDYRRAVTIHGDDVLAHGNWEISEEWLSKYGFLVEQATLNIANRWRRERGETELRLADLSPAEHTPGAT